MNQTQTKQTDSGKAPGKHTLYRTAKALIGCAYFNAGEIVSIQYSGFCTCHGTVWYEASKDGENFASYAMHQLTNFVL